MMVAVCEWSLGQVSLYCELSEKVVSMVTHTRARRVGRGVSWLPGNPPFSVICGWDSA